MAEQLNYQINIGGNVYESLGAVKKALKESNAELLEAQSLYGEYSKQAKVAADKVATLREAIKSANETAQLFDPGKRFQTLTNALSALAGGFAAVQGAIGLLGGESKELEKQLLKVQSALALSQGLSTISDSAKDFQRLASDVANSNIVLKANAVANTVTAATMKALGIAVDTTSTSFRVLKGVIAATGIGLAVIAISELISAISNYTSAADKAIEKQKELNAAITKGAEGALQAEIEQINRSNDLLVAQAKLRGASEKEIYEIEQTSRRLRIAARNRFDAEVSNKNQEAADKNLADIKKEQDAITLSEVNFQVAEKERRKKLNEEKLKEQEELEKQLLEGRQRAEKAGLDFDLAELDRKEKIKKDKEEERKKDEEDANKLFEEANDKENQRIEEQIEKRNKIVLNEKQAAEEEKKIRTDLENAKFAAASAGLNLLGALVGENEKLANALFIVDKALAIAKIVVDTQKEIAGYAANPTWTLLPDGGAAIKTKAILAAKLRAGASIATIGATTIAKFKGGAASANFGQGGAINTAGTPIVPTQQTQLTQLNQQSINAIGNSAIRAYVVETDITSNQKRVQAIKQRARFS